QNLHALPANQSRELKINLKDSRETAFAKYLSFNIGPESDEFHLAIGGYSGDAGDSMANHNDMKLSAKDQDHDVYSGDCAHKYIVGRWYYSCNHANLNGLYLNGAST
ncbi:hypothetical protein CAPTEDRAFT_79829, partial [Capitella teleta]